RRRPEGDELAVGDETEALRAFLAVARHHHDLALRADGAGVEIDVAPGEQLGRAPRDRHAIDRPAPVALRHEDDRTFRWLRALGWLRAGCRCRAGCRARSTRARSARARGARFGGRAIARREREGDQEDALRAAPRGEINRPR